MAPALAWTRLKEHTIPLLTPFEPVPGTVNHLLTARLRPDFKRAVAFGLLALVAGLVVRVFGDLSWVEVRPLSAGAQAFEDLHNGRLASAKVVLEPAH